MFTWTSPITSQFASRNLDNYPINLIRCLHSKVNTEKLELIDSIFSIKRTNLKSIKFIQFHFE